jgi:DNA-directed RNA polymerase specialized sigma24 family protein
VKRYSSPVSPELFESGDIGLSSSTTDIYFDDAPPEEVLKIVVSTLVDNLPEWEKSSVEMTIMSKMTYEQAAKEISIRRGIKTDKKTVWKWSRKGMEMLRESLEQPWVHNITGGRVPRGSQDGS